MQFKYWKRSKWILHFIIYTGEKVTPFEQRFSRKRNAEHRKLKSVFTNFSSISGTRVPIVQVIEKSRYQSIGNGKASVDGRQKRPRGGIVQSEPGNAISMIVKSDYRFTFSSKLYKTSFSGKKHFLKVENAVLGIEHKVSTGNSPKIKLEPGFL